MNQNVTSSPELFSDDWARAWMHAINESPYRESGASWNDRLLVRMDDGPSFLLELSGGECRSLERIPEAETDGGAPGAQVVASTTYNMVVEGTLAETGYHALYEVLDGRGILPALREGVGLLQRDESRHIAYGVYLLTRLIRVDAPMSPSA